MLQYLSAAFSLKPDYQDIAGHGDPNAHDLIGVAIQEMQHLSAVSRLLVELGSAPHMGRQDFPYEPDIYPFEFNLEPLTRRSVAKYTYTEAPLGATDPRMAPLRPRTRHLSAHSWTSSARARAQITSAAYGTPSAGCRPVPASRMRQLPRQRRLSTLSVKML